MIFSHENRNVRVKYEQFSYYLLFIKTPTNYKSRCTR